MEEQIGLEQMEFPPDYPPQEPDLLHDWLYRIIKPYLNGRVLEIASGLESLSALLVERGRRIHLSNPDSAIRQQLRDAYNGTETVRHVHSINIHRKNFADAYPEDRARIFDTVLVLNGIEDGVYDRKIVKNAIHLLQDKGRLILLAPAYTTVYDGIQGALTDLERVNRLSLGRLITDLMEVLSTNYFNLQSNPKYDRSGLSVLVVARKKDPA